MSMSTAWRLAVAALAVALFAIALTPNLTPQLRVQKITIEIRSPEKLPEELSGFLRFKTIGAIDAINHVPENNTKAFSGAHEYLKKSFPLVWEHLAVQTVSDWSLVAHWKGKNLSLKPAALLSHIDVVPADESPTSEWSHPPFAGHIEEGFVYGRGALDLKSNIIAILHAVNQLLAEGFEPQRSLYLVFGHDEELGGTYGAAQIVKQLQKEGVELEFVLDEGGVVIKDGLQPLFSTPIALVGTAEKDYSVVAIDVTSPGGHAAMPSSDGTSVGATLARIITSIDNSPPPIHLQAPTTDFLHAVGDGAPVRGLAWILRNAHRQVFGYVLGRLLALSPDTAALVRTTAAMTKLEGGHTYNVLPQTGRAVYNFRHLPGHTIEQVIDYVWSKVAKADRGRVNVTRLDDRRASSHISPPDGPHFKLIARAIQETFAQSQEPMLVAPYLVVGGTDSKLYSPLTRNVYRFQPVAISRKTGELSRIHGTDERISFEDLEQQTKFFLHFIRSCSKQSIGPA